MQFTLSENFLLKLIMNWNALLNYSRGWAFFAIFVLLDYVSVFWAWSPWSFFVVLCFVLCQVCVLFLNIFVFGFGGFSLYFLFAPSLLRVVSTFNYPKKKKNPFLKDRENVLSLLDKRSEENNLRQLLYRHGIIEASESHA